MHSRTSGRRQGKRSTASTPLHAQRLRLTASSQLGCQTVARPAWHSRHDGRTLKPSCATPRHASATCTAPSHTAMQATRKSRPAVPPPPPGLAARLVVSSTKASSMSAVVMRSRSSSRSATATTIRLGGTALRCCCAGGAALWRHDRLRRKLAALLELGEGEPAAPRCCARSLRSRRRSRNAARAATSAPSSTLAARRWRLPPLWCREAGVKEAMGSAEAQQWAAMRPAASQRMRPRK